MASQLTKRLVQLKRCSVFLPINQSRSYADIGFPREVVPFVEKCVEPSEENRSKTVTVQGTSDLSCISGAPVDLLKDRLVRIYRTPKNAMQSGTDNVDRWELEFDTKERWENPLMGWSSTGDPLSNVKLQFCDKEEAINYARTNGFQYYIEAERKVKPKVKSYGFNFSWNKRTRVSTK